MTALLEVHLAIGASHHRLGKLAWQDRRALFEFAPECLESGLSPSPLHLPPRPGVQVAPREPFAGLFGLFTDSLPDSYGRLLLDRRLRALGRDPSTLTPLDRLALVGGSGFGALRFLPADTIASDPPQPLPDLDRIQAEALAVIAGEASDMLEALQRLGGSAGGARPKAQLWIAPVGTLATTPGPAQHPWLVKFRAPSDPLDIGALESAYASMAAAAGIDVAPHRLLPSRTGPGHFASLRFDRNASGPLHLHSLAGLLHADPDGAAISYREYLRATHYLTRDIRAVEAAFRRMVFNVLAHNRDDHARNHAFLMNEDGEWSLAPAFDLTFAPGPGGEHYLAISGEGRSPTLAHLLAEGAAAGLTAKRMNPVIQQVQAAIATWPALAKAAGMAPPRITEIAAALPAIPW